MDKNYELYKAACSVGKAIFGFFRLDNGQMVRATWQREFPGCYISGQGGTVWSLSPVSPEVEQKVVERWGL